ncbi:MAG: c-type cytochrome, partial [Nitrospirota bacterium]
MKGIIISIAAVTLLLTTAIAGYSLTAGDGAVIYAINCAPCHGAGDAGIDPLVKKTNAGQITQAYNHYTSMSHAILRTNTSVLLGAIKRNLTQQQISAINARLALNKPPLGISPGMLQAKQEGAIVADLSLYRGEDLYNAKYPNNTTWNCSFCHGSYDNSTLLQNQRTYNWIVRGFRQNANHNNMMTPLRSKYTLTDLNLIAKALAVAPPFSNTSGTASIDGATLYYINCMDCHNGPISQVAGTAPTYNGTVPAITAVAKAGSAVNGANLIQTAITNNAGAGTTLGGMGTLNLTTEQITAIATAIQQDQKPADPSIYSSLS